MQIREVPKRLQQASCEWFSKFSNTLLKIGFRQSLADYTVFTRLKGQLFILPVLSCDIIVAGNDLVEHSFRTNLNLNEEL